MKKGTDDAVDLISIRGSVGLSIISAVAVQSLSPHLTS